MNCLVLLTVRRLGEATYPVIVNDVASQTEAIKIALTKVKFNYDPENNDCISKVDCIELYKDIIVIDNQSRTDES